MTVIRVSPELHQAFKLEAVRRKMTMTKLVAEAIEAYCKTEPTKDAA
jgi:predicted HicB family RNase H-like nuclease